VRATAPATAGTGPPEPGTAYVASGPPGRSSTCGGGGTANGREAEDRFRIVPLVDVRATLVTRHDRVWGWLDGDGTVVLGDPQRLWRNR
jgi:hypothetical protein